MTGVTKFSQITVFSGFNQPNDISMDSKYDAICGITETELHTVFAEAIIQMATRLEYTVDEMKAVLKKLKDADPSKEEMIAQIAVQTQGFKVISKSDCETLINRITAMLEGGTD